MSDKHSIHQEFDRFVAECFPKDILPAQRMDLWITWMAATAHMHRLLVLDMPELPDDKAEAFIKEIEAVVVTESTRLAFHPNRGN